MSVDDEWLLQNIVILYCRDELELTEDEVEEPSEEVKEEDK